MAKDDSIDTMVNEWFTQLLVADKHTDVNLG
jgi:hypothetical protein